jgi:hypothetical protein
VPGNHDVDWELSSQAYRLIPRFKLATDPSDEVHIPAGPAGVLLRDEAAYRNRFDHFSSQFYTQICDNGGYSKEYASQGVLTLFQEHRIMFLGLNSCWNLDHHFTDRASIHPEAVSLALNQMAEPRKWLKIGVWHHPVSGAGAMNDDFLQLLSVHGFAIGFHGHIHEAIERFHRYDDRRGIHIIGAGTFGAPVRQQVTGIPLQYNFLELDRGTRALKVNSRRKEKRYGAWSADARWGDKNHPSPSYVVDLSGYWSPPPGPAAASPE